MELITKRTTTIYLCAVIFALLNALINPFGETVQGIISILTFLFVLVVFIIKKRAGNVER